MSRAGEPLHGGPETAWERRAEILLTAGGYKLGDYESRHLLIVVLIDEMLRYRLIVPALVGMFRHATQTFTTFELSEAPWPLGQLVAQPLLCVATLIVALPSQGKATFTEVDAVVEAVTSAQNLTISTVVGVAEEPAFWKPLKQVRRFVSSAGCGQSLALKSLCQVLGAGMAPTAVLELDDAAVGECLGDADRPSFLLRATWSREDARLTVVDDCTPGICHVGSSLVTMLDCPRPGDVQAVLAQWGRLAPGQTGLWASAPSSFYALGSRAFEAPQDIVILCTPRAGSDWDGATPFFQLKT